MLKVYDTVICGGAAVGSSVAYFLSKMRGGKKPSILVLEMDTTYKHSATALCAASYRTQFSTPENIQMSLFGGRFFKDITSHLGVNGEDVSIQLREDGYLFLGSKTNVAGVKNMRDNFVTQTKEGAKVVLMKPTEIAAKYPWMKTDDLELVGIS